MKRANSWVPVCALVALLAVQGHHACARPQARAGAGKPPKAAAPAWKVIHPSAPWKEVKAILDEAVRSDLYKAGAKIGPVQPSDPWMQSALCYRILVDLLRSLTPAQVAAIQRAPLPFTELTKQQQKLLLRVAQGAPAVLLSQAQTSRIWIDKYTRRDRTQGCMFNWRIRHGSGFDGMSAGLDSRSYPGRPASR